MIFAFPLFVWGIDSTQRREDMPEENGYEWRSMEG